MKKSVYSGTGNVEARSIGEQYNNASEYKLDSIQNNKFGIEVNGEISISGGVNIVGDISAARCVRINGNAKIDEGVNFCRKKNENIEINEAAGMSVGNILKIKSGQAELIASGTVIAFKGHPIEVEITADDESLRLIFFFSEENQGNIPVKANILNAQTVELTLFRARNSLNPTGTLKPFSLGTWRGKQLYLHYRVYDIQDGDSTICFNIYLQNEAL